MSEAAIAVKGVSKSFKLPHEKHSGLKQAVINFRPGKKYEVQPVLQDVSFEIKKGEFFGIVGRNGSGKSTLLKLLAQIYTPDKGAIEANGSLTPFIELGVGFNPELTGRENVFLNGALLGFDRKQVTLMYDDIVSFAEIERFMDQKLKNYSSGMQVRLAFSIAIRAKSDILLIDEVLAVGDAAFQRKCFNYFRRLKREKQTVVFVSHDMASVQEFCDRTLLLDRGKVQLIGNTMDIASEYLLLMGDSGKATIADENTVRHGDFEFLETKVQKKEAIFRKNEEVKFSIKYRLKKSLDYEIGISIMKASISVHERNTKEVALPTAAGEHQITWSAPASGLLGGLHTINIAAFTKDKFNLIAFANDAEKFYIQRDDIAVGGLADINSKWALS